MAVLHADIVERILISLWTRKWDFDADSAEADTDRQAFVLGEHGMRFPSSIWARGVGWLLVDRGRQ